MITLGGKLHISRLSWLFKVHPFQLSCVTKVLRFCTSCTILFAQRILLCIGTFVPNGVTSDSWSRWKQFKDLIFFSPSSSIHTPRPYPHLSTHLFSRSILSDLSSLCLPSVVCVFPSSPPIFPFRSSKIHLPSIAYSLGVPGSSGRNEVNDESVGRGPGFGQKTEWSLWIGAQRVSAGCRRVQAESNRMSA